jgi:hypothetical protein
MAKTDHHMKANEHLFICISFCLPVNAIDSIGGARLHTIVRLRAKQTSTHRFFIDPDIFISPT